MANCHKNNITNTFGLKSFKVSDTREKKEAEGRLYPKPTATKLASLEVQRRSLVVYDVLS
ncbi:hypothetical protein [Acetomicrobium sp.]|uniref:hypothetical protein n=1 Tax=Acetomicrobium sp. TaxID=1872099 RepID=UPI001BCCB55D|nr:hypothetical protein [Acetomicrobium sp.]